MASVAELYNALVPDPWRESAGFSSDLLAFQGAMLQPDLGDASVETILSEWLSSGQPCLFGRIAAKHGGLSFCILHESDLAGPDEAIQQKIRTARLNWRMAARKGGKSGFIVFILSRRIAQALPNQAMSDLAQRLAFLYLRTPIQMDAAHLEEIFLEVPGNHILKWPAGVNYFCAQGDGRWWHDHRIPGGLAFSVNSVGHMVKSGILAKRLLEVQAALGYEDRDIQLGKLDSLVQALGLAMRTIGNAKETDSGRATELLPAPKEQGGSPLLDLARLPRNLRDRNLREYQGYYDTDHTLPSAYFRPDISRPEDVPPLRLDFTYLTEPGIDNPDYEEMGEGLQILASGVETTATKCPAGTSKGGTLSSAEEFDRSSEEL